MLYLLWSAVRSSALLPRNVSPLLRLAVLQPEESGRNVSMNALTIRRINWRICIRGHEDLNGLVLEPDCALIQAALYPCVGVFLACV